MGTRRRQPYKTSTGAGGGCTQLDMGKLPNAPWSSFANDAAPEQKFGTSAKSEHTLKQRGRKKQYDMYGNIPPRSYGGLHVVKSPAPEHLGDVEQQLWQSICEQNDLDGAASTAVLVTGLEAHMRARLAREVIAVEGMQIEDRFQQPKIHPLLVIERSAWSVWLAAIKTLGLEL